jgi:choline-sulfatase
MADQNAWQAHRDSIEDRVLEFHYWGGRMPVADSIPTKPNWRCFLDPTRVWMNADCLPEPGYERDVRGTFLVEKAIEFLKQPHTQPFALWVSFSEPHAPFNFPVEDSDAFNADQFQHPPIGPTDWDAVPLVFRELTDDDHRGISAAHYTSVSYLDRNIGRILRALKQLGLDDNTLVVYTSDHGALLGHHGRVEKHCLFDQAIRTPLLMRLPSRFAGGRVVHALTETVDVPGTLLDLLGGERLPVDHGQSLVPLLEGRTASHRSEVFSEYLENEEAGLRTERWKFWYCSGKRHRRDGLETDNPTPGRYVRLFDLESDPGEFNSLSADPSSAPIIAQMKQRLLALFLATHPEAPDLPPGLAVEDQLDWFLRPRDGHFSGAGPRAVKYGIDDNTQKTALEVKA